MSGCSCVPRCLNSPGLPVPDNPTYEDFVDVSRAIIQRKGSLEQQGVIARVLSSLLPSFAPQMFRLLFPFQQWSSELNAQITKVRGGLWQLLACSILSLLISPRDVCPPPFYLPRCTPADTFWMRLQYGFKWLVGPVQVQEAEVEFNGKKQVSYSQCFPESLPSMSV